MKLNELEIKLEIGSDEHFTRVYASCHYWVFY